MDTTLLGLSMKYDKSIESQLPITFDNKCTFTQLTCLCNGCKKSIDPRSLKGTIALFNPGVALFDALGYCVDCNSSTPVFGRVRSHEKTMVVEMQRREGWSSLIMTKEKTSDRIKSILSSLDKRLKSYISNR